LVDERGIEGLQSHLDAKQITTFSPMGSLSFDLRFQPLGSLPLPLTTVHPFRLVVAVEAVNLESRAVVANWVGFVAFLAPNTARPAAANTTRLGRHGLITREFELDQKTL
jgi:hypothetical protein